MHISTTVTQYQLLIFVQCSLLNYRLFRVSLELPEKMVTTVLMVPKER